MSSPVAGWKRKRISELAENVFAGATPNTKISSFWENGNIPWMSSGEINNETIEGTASFITEDGFNNSSTKMVPIHSVLVALAGQGKTRGKVATNKIELCTNQSLAAIVPNQQIFYKYLYYNLQRRYVELRELSSGDGGRGGLNLKLINGISVDFPPLPEQKKIAEILSTWDEAIENSDQLISGAINYKNSIISNVLSKKSGSSGWKQIRLGNVIEEVSERTTINNQHQILTSSRSGIFLQEDYFKKSVASKDNIGYKIIKKGEFTFRAMSDDGTFKFNRLIEHEIGIVSPAYSVFKATHIEPRFLDAYMNSHIFTKEIAKASQGGTRLSLKYSALSKFKITIPRMDLQIEIANLIDSLEKYITGLKNYKIQLINQKQGLMQRLLTGKVRVKLD